MDIEVRSQGQVKIVKLRGRLSLGNQWTVCELRWRTCSAVVRAG